MNENTNCALEYLHAPKDKVILFRPNSGNTGDSLINCATLQLFVKAGIQYQIIKTKNIDTAGRVVIYGGGGNFVDMYPNAREFI